MIHVWSFIKMVSHEQKIAVYYAKINANPSMSKTAVYNFYKGSKHGMRKQDALDIIGHLKNAATYKKDMNDSKAPKETKDRANKAIYKRAKMTTKKYLKKNPLKKGKKRATVKEVYGKTFGVGDKPNDFQERY